MEEKRKEKDADLWALAWVLYSGSLMKRRLDPSAHHPVSLCR